MSVKRTEHNGAGHSRTGHNRWIAGDVLSWALGVTLGVVLGVVLLIVAPRLGGAQGEAAPGPEGTIAAPAQTEQGASEAGGDGAQAGAESESGGAGDDAQAGSMDGADQGPGTDTTSVAGQTGTEATVEPTGNNSADRQRAQGEVGTSTAQNTGPEDTAEEAIENAPRGADENEDPQNGAAPASPDGSTEATGEPQSGAGAAGATPVAAASAAGDPAAGQTVYVGNCSGCHGANGQGVVGPSLVTADGPKSWTLAQFTASLREGRTPDRQLSAAMPRYSEAQISDAQVADLHAYIKTLN